MQHDSICETGCSIGKSFAVVFTDKRQQTQQEVSGQPVVSHITVTDLCLCQCQLWLCAAARAHVKTPAAAL